MDPIKIFPDEVSEIIFSHFKGRELLKLSFVNQEWNSFIGSSSRCMKNLTLGMRGDWMSFTQEEKNILLNGREYQSVLISDGTEVLSFINDVVKARKKWKTVKIFDTKFPSTSSLYELLEVFKDFVEHLELMAVTVEKHEEHRDQAIEFKFKKLKTLKISFCEDKIGVKVVRSCSTLRILSWDNSKGSWDNSIDIADSLKNQVELVKLNVTPKTVNCISASNVKDFVFKLEDFSVTKFSCFGRFSSIEDQLVDFLRAQRNSIKELSLGDWFGLKVMKFVLQMQNLKTLRMMNIPTLDWDEIKLPSSPSIELLDIVTTCTRNEVKMKAILMTVPNVQQLRLRSIDESLAKFLSKTFKQLRTIHLVHPPQKLTKNILPSIDFKV